MKRTALERSEGLKRGGGLKRGRRRKADRAAARRFHDAARAQGVCAVTGTRGPWEAHHVIERQELRRRGVDEWDPRNAMRLVKPVHHRHTLAVKRVALTVLSDENIRFAFEVMGTAAHPYLHRMYAGEDLRVEDALYWSAPRNVTPIRRSYTNDVDDAA